MEEYSVLREKYSKNKKIIKSINNSTNKNEYITNNNTCQTEIWVT